eukprot:CAMPEP_0176154894 /NCGR_PEP_ID=MMETSP0120_2-20121206/79137_1 /TAXON_ID=160619 /ORGANISM="Kryptoperidinium foliaceum, Strain CCMP 1326" /LENGTH=154 /DNA_ID=CAMNT_0017492007 /DNA_START=121 /DNA_END=585 /DNA_ORIENTATION=-
MAEGIGAPKPRTQVDAQPLAPQQCQQHHSLGVLRGGHRHEERAEDLSRRRACAPEQSSLQVSHDGLVVASRHAELPSASGWAHDLLAPEVENKRLALHMNGRRCRATMHGRRIHVLRNADGIASDGEQRPIRQQKHVRKVHGDALVAVLVDHRG